MHSKIQSVTRHFGITPQSISPAPSQGFSGAGIWKVTDLQGQSFSVKRHNEFAPDHLAWIHRVLRHTRICDCDFVPEVRQTENGNSHLEFDNAIWETSSWMPGEAGFADHPNDERLKNAMKALAKFHQSAAQVNFDFRPSPGVKRRSDALADLPNTLRRAAQSIQNSPNLQPQTELQTTLQSLNRIASTCIDQHADALKTMLQQTLPLQPVIRDLWHDHLLFTEDRLTGLIDFDAMQMDSIAMDLTRCLASIVPDDPDRWGFALTAYASVRPIQRSEMDLIDVIDPINVILSAANWLKWIAIERRHFANPGAVRTRLGTINRRLVNLVQ